MFPAPPPLAYLATVHVQVASPVEVGETPGGYRRIIPIVGGTVRGPGLNGTVLSVGADFQVLRSETLTELRAEYVIETDGGDRVYVNNFGIRSGSAVDIERLVRGQEVDPGRIYFRCSPRLTPVGESVAWLGERLLVGTGERYPGEVHVHLFTVD